jgi:DNA-binding CsgD family transcriptional regulator
MLAMKVTPREKDVLERVCDGATTKTIAHELGVSEQAVKAHIGHLFQKFGVTNRASLAAAATNARVVRRQAISDRYHERARALGRENTVLRGANTALRGANTLLRGSNAALRSRQTADRKRPTRGRTVRAGERRGGKTAGR